MRVFFFILSLVLSGPVFAETAKTRGSGESFAEFRPLLFQVRTASDASAEKRSYGTGFVINREGWLATNFHVIADAVWKSPRQKIFVMTKDGPVPGRLLGVNIREDLAVIKVDMTFPAVVATRGKPVQPGETVYSLGLPEDLDWTLVSGIYNGPIEQGPYRLLHLSSPINSGMSGGPTVNAAGSLVGVNVSRRLSSQNISFAVPAAALWKLVDRIHARKAVEIDPLDDIKADVGSLENDMADLLLRGLGESKRLESWDLPKFPSSVRCWGNDADGFDAAKIRASMETCDVEQSLFIDGNKFFGTFRVKTQRLTRLKLSDPAWLHLRNQAWGSIDLAQTLPIDKDSAINFARAKCEEGRVATPKGIAQVRTCAQRILPFDDLFEAEITVSWGDSERHLVVSAMVSGIGKAHMASVVRRLLDGPVGGFHVAD